MKKQTKKPRQSQSTAGTPLEDPEDRTAAEYIDSKSLFAAQTILKIIKTGKPRDSVRLQAAKVFLDKTVPSKTQIGLQQGSDLTALSSAEILGRIQEQPTQVVQGYISTFKNYVSEMEAILRARAEEIEKVDEDQQLLEQDKTIN